MADKSSKEVNFKDLFKSEIEPDGEPVLTNCVHCQGALTKSDLVKGKVTVGVVEDNTQPHKGKPGHNKATPVRAGKGGKVVGEANPGSHAKKSDAEESASEDEVEKGMCKDCGKAPCACKNKMKKGTVQEPIITGSEYAGFIDNGNDQRIADMIEKGELGYGAVTSKPIDGNEGASRLFDGRHSR